MMINSNWLKKDFKQKYYLFCRECKVEIRKFANIKNKNYICEKLNNL